MRKPDSTLEAIAGEYRARGGTQEGPRSEDITAMFSRYFEGRVRPLAEALSCGAATAALLSDGFDPSKLSPQELEAFELAFPNLEVAAVANYSGEQLEGLLNPWKGKLFEVKVRDSLNEGNWVGNLHLDEGQRAVLAESANQAGWDMQILEADGTVAQQIQLKATDFVHYVEAAAERYPEVPIVTTTEAAGASAGDTPISAADISDGHMEEQLRASVEDGLSGSVWDVVLPALPVALNLYWYAKGDRTAEQAVRAVAASTAAVGATVAAGDILGDLLVDVATEVALGFGLGFVFRKFFGWAFGGDREVKHVPEKVIDEEALAARLQRAALQLKGIQGGYPQLPAAG